MENFPNKHISILKDLGHAAVLKHAIFRDVQHRSDRHGSPLWNARNRSSRAPFGRPWRIAIWSSWTAAAARPVAAVVFRNVERGRFPSRHGATPSRHQSCFSCEVMVINDYQACFSTKSWSSMTTGWFGNTPISGNCHILIIHDYHRWIDDDDDDGCGDGGGGAAAADGLTWLVLLGHCWRMLT